MSENLKSTTTYVSGLDKNIIQGRLETLTSDIKKLQDVIVDLEKRKTETIAQLNAFQGAKQQCQMFLQEFNNEAKSGDMGELPSVDDPFAT